MWSWPDNERDVLSAETANFRYHKQCYITFCGKNKVTRAMKTKKGPTARCKWAKHAKIAKTALRKTFLGQNSVICNRFHNKKVFMSVLPLLRIICKRNDAYIMEKVYNSVFSCSEGTFMKLFTKIWNTCLVELLFRENLRSMKVWCSPQRKRRVEGRYKLHLLFCYLVI